MRYVEADLDSHVLLGTRTGGSESAIRLQCKAKHLRGRGCGGPEITAVSALK